MTGDVEVIPSAAPSRHRRSTTASRWRPVQGDVALCCAKMRLVHRNASEPALPEMPVALESFVDRAGVAAMHRRQCAMQAVGIAGHQDEMNMVGHQRPAPNLDPGGRAMLGQEVTVERVIAILEEDLLAAVAALGRDAGGRGRPPVRGVPYGFLARN